MPNNAKISNYNNLPGLYPTKFKVYIMPGNNKKTWKATMDFSSNIFSQTVSRNSRPQTNLSVDSNYERSMRSAFNGEKYRGPLNPLKQWRKQLAPTDGSSSNRVSVSQAIDYPGGATHLEKSNASDCSSCAPLLTNYLTQYPVDCSNCPGSSVIRNSISNYQPVIINNPQRITRPATTIVKKSYYTTGTAYLKSRVKLYEQNQSLNPFQSSTEYVNNPNRPKSATNYVYPTNDENKGSQLYHSTYCCDASDSPISVKIIYKPNNPFFSSQGAVSSSTRLVQQKYQAITKNNSDFTTNLKVNNQTLPGATPVNYRGDDDAPYFIKSKYQQIDNCTASGYSSHSKVNFSKRMPSGGSGIKTVCFS